MRTGRARAAAVTSCITPASLWRAAQGRWRLERPCQHQPCKCSLSSTNKPAARCLLNDECKVCAARTRRARAAVVNELHNLSLGGGEQLEEESANRARRTRLAVAEPVGTVAAAPRGQAQPPPLRRHVPRRQRPRRRTQPPVQRIYVLYIALLFVVVKPDWYACGFECGWYACVPALCRDTMMCQAEACTFTASFIHASVTAKCALEQCG